VENRKRVTLEELTEKWTHKRVKYYENDGCEIVAKVCTKCSKVKELDGYSKKKGCLGGRLSYCKSCEARYRQENKERRADNLRKWRKENEDHVRKYYEANKEREADRTRKWYESNREHVTEYNRKYREENKELRAETCRKWQRNNPDKSAMNKQRYRARKAGLPDDFTSAQQSKVIASFNNACALTGDTSWSWDHAIPINSGHGGTTFNNMYPLRGDLNSSKGDRNIFDWYYANSQRFNLDREKFNSLIAYLADLNEMTPEEYREHVYFCHENSNEIGGTGA
jgi:hypothetical protein